MERKNNITRIICEVGIFAAIGYILDEIQGVIAFSFTSGGSIGIAMVAVLIIAYRRGLLPAIATGLIMGLLDFATKAYVVHPMQVFLDYLFPYALVGLAGLFKPLFDKTDNRKYKLIWIIAGCVFGGVLKFFSHFFAGLFFWNNPDWFSWNLNYMSPALYSFVYNIAYIGPCILLSIAVMTVLFLKSPRLLMTEGEVKTYLVSEESNRRNINIYLASVAVIIGVSMFVYYLINYIRSFYYDSYYQKFYMSGDCMVIWLFGLAFGLLGVNHLIQTLKKRIRLDNTCLISSLVMFAYSGYGLARILEMYIDNQTPVQNIYWAWFIPTLVIAILLLLTFFNFSKKEVKE